MWLRIFLGIGFILGLLLFVRTFLSYRYVSEQLLTSYLGQRAGDYITEIQNMVRTLEPGDSRELQDLLDVFFESNAEQLAYVGIFNQQGSPAAFASTSDLHTISQSTIDSILVSGEQSVIQRGTGNEPERLVLTTPFRFRIDRGQPGPPEAGAAPGSPRFMIAQIALRSEGMSDAYAPLRRNLVVSVAAAFALLISITTVILRLKSYLKGQELEQQLALAGHVQRELLPDELPALYDLEISAEFEPAQGVAGDYYDVFVMKDGRISLLLGDVSGKGIPAAIIMASLHGSVHATDLEPGSDRLSKHIFQLNRDLYARTPANRFVTLVWSVYDPETRTLEYVNAGHPAPILLRESDSGPALIEQLDQGGPPLGAFLTSSYSQAEKKLKSGDLLVFYSDGLDEAENRDGEMYGEDRVIEVVRSRAGESSEVVREAIVRNVLSFTEGSGHQDDLTLLVVRIP